MAVASTVTVNFTAETAKFENGVKKARKLMKGFRGLAGRAFRGASVAVGALTVALVALTKQSLATVDAQRKAARTIGTTQRIYAGLSLAAEVSGLSVQAFEKALKKQQKAITDANDGLLTQKRALDRLGLSTKELITLPVDQQFKKITTALGKVENATLKSGIASDIFGARNADLINILELGEAGLDSFINKVDELGVALTDRQTGAIEEANDSILIMKKAFTGLGNQLAAQVAPALIKAAKAIEGITAKVTQTIPKWSAWAANIFGVERALNGLTLRDMAEELLIIDKAIFQQKNTIARQVDELRNLNDETRKMTDAQLEELPVIKRLDAEYQRLQDRYDKILRARIELKKTGEIVAPETGAGGDGPVGALDADKFQKDFEAATRSVATAVEKLQAKLGEIRNNLTTNPLWTPELAGRQAQQAVDAYLAELDRVKIANQTIIDAQRAQFESAFDAVATPAEQLEMAFAEIRENLANNPFWTPELARRQGQAAVDAYLEEMERIATESGDVFSNLNEFQLEAARNSQDIFAQFLFDPFDAGLKGMLKSFVDMLRKMVAQLIASKLLTSFLTLFPGADAAVASSTGVTSLVPAAIGGNRAGGRQTLVGEKGPELYTPGATGAIRPIGALNFESNTTIGGGGGMDVATLIPILEENNRKVKAEILDAFDRGAYA